MSVFMNGWTVIGEIREAVPNTKSILKMFEPMIFPTAMSTFFFIEATTVTTSSGNEVPIAIIVDDIKNSENPNCVAIKTAPSTTNFPPKNRPTNPARISPIDL